MSDDPIISNSYLSNNPDISPRATTVNHLGKQTPVQHVILAGSDGEALSPGAFAMPMVTFVPSRVSLPNNTDKQIIASNNSRKAGSYILNNTGATIWGNYGSTTAVLNEGFKILNQQVFLFNTTQAIRLIQNSGSAVVVDIFEAT